MFNAKDKKELEELSNSSNTIGKGTAIEGDIESFGNVRVDGAITGNVTTKSKVVIGESAKIQGNVSALNAEISGEVKGTVEVAELLVLKSTAIIHGDIVTNRMVIESGAVFNGSSKMGAVVKDIKIGEQARTSEEKTA